MIERRMAKKGYVLGAFLDIEAAFFYSRAPFIFNFVFKPFEFEISEFKFELKLSDCTYYRLS